MMKQKICALLIALITLVLCSCNSDVNSMLEEGNIGFSQEYQNYLLNHDKLPQSVLDALDFLLDNYISGTSTPSIDSIPQDTVPAGSSDSQQIIDSSNGVITSESELVSLIYTAVKNIDSEITFETEGTWCSDDVIYDCVFRQVHDTYMIDAYGIHSYHQTVTQNSDGNNIYRIQFNYLDNLAASEIQNQRDEITRAAKDIVLSLSVSGKSEYEIIYDINQYLCDHIYYPDEPYISNDFTPYGAFISGRAVCDGYARATKILSDFCNLECYYVSGNCNNTSGVSGHAWNLVKIDGQYYQLDVTWNDCGQSNDYFLVTDDFMSLSRTWERSNYPASAQLPYNP